jgi:hypothetical protein
MFVDDLVSMGEDSEIVSSWPPKGPHHLRQVNGALINEVEDHLRKIVVRSRANANKIRHTPGQRS